MNALTLAQKGNLFGISPQTLLAELKIFKESIVKTDYEHDSPVATYEVAAQDLVAAFSGEKLSTGLLPPDTLFYERIGISERIAIYVPASKKVIRLGREYAFPSPPLVFMGKGKKYCLFAVKERPRNLQDMLYKAPFPNVGEHGRICRGTAGFPACAKDTIYEALDVFFDSAFTSSYTRGKSKKFDNSVLDAYEAYKDHQEWPLDDLVHDLTLRRLIGGKV